MSLAWALRPQSIIDEHKFVTGYKAVNRAVAAADSSGPDAWEASCTPCWLSPCSGESRWTLCQRLGPSATTISPYPMPCHSQGLPPSRGRGAALPLQVGSAGPPTRVQLELTKDASAGHVGGTWGWPWRSCSAHLPKRPACGSACPVGALGRISCHGNAGTRERAGPVAWRWRGTHAEVHEPEKWHQQP